MYFLFLPGVICALKIVFLIKKANHTFIKNTYCIWYYSSFCDCSMKKISLEKSFLVVVVSIKICV
jgi:hypothetical protein